MTGEQWLLASVLGLAAAILIGATVWLVVGTRRDNRQIREGYEGLAQLNSEWERRHGL